MMGSGDSQSACPGFSTAAITCRGEVANFGYDCTGHVVNCRDLILPKYHRSLLFLYKIFEEKYGKASGG
jgi:hypothetical protein